ncbi:MAG: hypothetical protein GKR94_03045 [Gammaproteobacteria bacterium]|nr:hypothetical protein [Gammaproteobacteria bacterium]
MRLSRRRLVRSSLAVAAVAMTVPACGQKGDLYFPSDYFPGDNKSRDNKSPDNKGLDGKGPSAKSQKVKQEASIAPDKG